MLTRKIIKIKLTNSFYEYAIFLPIPNFVI